MAKDKQYGSPTLTRDETAAKTTATSPVVSKPVAGRPSVMEPARRETPASLAMPFGRQNYTLLLAGIGIILAGFFIMSLDKEEFGFGFLGLTLGPLVVMAGFVVEFFAILTKPRA